MRTLKCVMWLILSTCILWLACSDKIITDFQEVGKKEVLINVRGLSQISIQGEERDIISVAESLILKIQPSDGKEQVHPVKLTPRDSVIIFEEVVVEKDTVVFSAEILSNNGTQIYFGSKTVDVSQDEYAVEIKLDPVAAILAVAPDSLFVNPYDTFLVFNRGVDSLIWNIGELTLQQTPLVFEPFKGNISKKSSLPVEIFSQFYADTNFVVRIESQVGHVELNAHVANREDNPVRGTIFPTFKNIPGGISVAEILNLEIIPMNGSK